VRVSERIWSSARAIGVLIWKESLSRAVKRFAFGVFLWVFVLEAPAFEVSALRSTGTAGASAAAEVLLSKTSCGGFPKTKAPAVHTP